MADGVLTYATPTRPSVRPVWYRICWWVLLCAVVMLYTTIACGVLMLLAQRYYAD